MKKSGSGSLKNFSCRNLKKLEHGLRLGPFPQPSPFQPLPSISTFAILLQIILNCVILSWLPFMKGLESGFRCLSLTEKKKIKLYLQLVEAYFAVFRKFVENHSTL